MVHPAPKGGTESNNKFAFIFSLPETEVNQFFSGWVLQILQKVHVQC